MATLYSNFRGVEVYRMNSYTQVAMWRLYTIEPFDMALHIQQVLEYQCNVPARLVPVTAEQAKANGW